MLALAHRFDRLLRDGVVTQTRRTSRDSGMLVRARVTQIMNLLQLAPDIQESILFLPRLQGGRELIQEHQIRPIAANPDWSAQRRLWAQLAAANLSSR
jgi:hypothetical protein